MLHRHAAAILSQAYCAILTMTDEWAGPRAESAMSGTELFSDVWSEEIWREIQPEYEQLCSTMPQRIQEKATKPLQENAQKKERRKEEGDDDGEEDAYMATLRRTHLSMVGRLCPGQAPVNQLATHPCDPWLVL